jgi:nucleotide-binding universal stress UspA family protein
MTMLERILFPVDGSEASLAVMPSVRETAVRAGSEVIVLRAVDTVASALLEYPDTVAADATAHARARAVREAEEVATRLRESGIHSRARVTVGSAAESILLGAVEERAGVVAMSTHGRSGISRLAFGSVAERVLRESPVPVLVARSAATAAEARTFRHILVPIEGTDVVVALLEAAARLARLFEAQITVVHYVSHHADQAAVAEGQGFLVVACRMLAERGLGARAQLRRGDAAARIVEYGSLDVGELPVDLIAVASHQRTALRRWVWGSVTEEVLRHATVPVLMVPSATRASLARPLPPRMGDSQRGDSGHGPPP